MSELTTYRKLLKDNEAEIKRLTDANKHIKEHIKFLEKYAPELEVGPVSTSFVEAPLTTTRVDEGKEVI